MPNEGPNQGTGRWEQQVRDVAARVEEELRQAVTYFNDEVVPDVRRNGSAALRAAATELQKLAQRMDDRQAETGQAGSYPKDQV